MFKWLKGVFSDDEDKIEKEVDVTEEIDDATEINLEADEDSVSEDSTLVQIEGDVVEEIIIEDDNSAPIEELPDNEISTTEEIETPGEIEEVPTFEVDEIELEAEEELYELNNEEVSEKPVSLFQRLFQGLEKTRTNFTDKLNLMLGNYIEIDEDMFEEIEDILITADVGVPTTLELIERLRENIKVNKVTDPSLVLDILMEETKGLISESETSDFNPNIAPTIILVVGVNGVGKTTTIGKLASKYKAEGKRVLLAAADTFRAAAIEQLQEWANRSGTELIHQSEGSDPAAVVFDAIQAAKSRKSDILICDTAGRLHNKANLMKELEKIYRIIDTNYPEANKESLIVLDATTGQNAIQQAKTFKEIVNVTGIVLTKLDGTAKGGVVLPLISELKLPVVYIGVGERIDDLQEFNPNSFVNSIFGKN